MQRTLSSMFLTVEILGLFIVANDLEHRLHQEPNAKVFIDKMAICDRITENVSIGNLIVKIKCYENFSSGSVAVVSSPSQ